MLQGAHDRRVYANIECFQAIGIARRIEQAVDRFGIRAFAFRSAQHGAVGLGHNARRIRRKIRQQRDAACEARVEFAREGFRPGNANLPIGVGASRQSGDWRSQENQLPATTPAFLPVPSARCRSGRRTADRSREHARPFPRSLRAPRWEYPTPQPCATGDAGRCRKPYAPSSSRRRPAIRTARLRSRASPPGDPLSARAWDATSNRCARCRPEFRARPPCSSAVSSR